MHHQQPSDNAFHIRLTYHTRFFPLPHASCMHLIPFNFPNGKRMTGRRPPQPPSSISRHNTAAACSSTTLIVVLLPPLLKPMPPLPYLHQHHQPRCRHQSTMFIPPDSCRGDNDLACMHVCVCVCCCVKNGGRCRRHHL